MRRGKPGDTGETLIEILVTVAILGTTVLAVLAALWAAISASVYHRKEADADVAAKAYAEALRLTVSQLYADDWCTSHAAGYTLTVTPSYPSDWSGSVAVSSLGACPARISTNVNTPQYRTATVTATPTGGTAATQTIVLTPSWCYNSAAGTC